MRSALTLPCGLASGLRLLRQDSSRWPTHCSSTSWTGSLRHIMGVLAKYVHAESGQGMYVHATLPVLIRHTQLLMVKHLAESQALHDVRPSGTIAGRLGEREYRLAQCWRQWKLPLLPLQSWPHAVRCTMGQMANILCLCAVC